MSSTEDDTYSPRPEIASESGSGALAAIYRRAIERYEEMKEGGSATALDDAERRSDEIGATEDLTK